MRSIQFLHLIAMVINNNSKGHLSSPWLVDIYMPLLLLCFQLHHTLHAPHLTHSVTLNTHTHTHYMHLISLIQFLSCCSANVIVLLLIFLLHFWCCILCHVVEWNKLVWFRMNEFNQNEMNEIRFTVINWYGLIHSEDFWAFSLIFICFYFSSYQVTTLKQSQFKKWSEFMYV